MFNKHGIAWTVINQLGKVGNKLYINAYYLFAIKN